MLDVKKEGVILEPTQADFEKVGVINPGVVQEGNKLHLFYRAVGEGNHSSVGYCQLEGPTKVVERSPAPILRPETDYEKQGIEDPRIVFFEDLYHMMYTAFDGKNARVGYATSPDLRTWTRQGTLSPSISYDRAEDLFRQCRSNLKEKYFFFESYYKDKMGVDVLLWSKDAFIIPAKFGGRYAMIHRILPDIQLIYFNDFKQLTDLKFWEEYLYDLDKHIVLESVFGYESRNIGGGAPLIETDLGWLMIYHAVEDTNKGKVYHAAAALLEKENPLNAIGHLPYPLFSPTEEYEKKGTVPNVVFPNATAIFDDRLFIYYGCADAVIAAASVELDELLLELTKH